MWSFDRTVQIEKPLVTFPWRSIGFYALTGQSVIMFKERLIKETIVEALEEIREQNPVGRILLVADNYTALITRNSPTNSASSSSLSRHIPPRSTRLNRSGRVPNEKSCQRFSRTEFSSERSSRRHFSG